MTNTNPKKWALVWSGPIATEELNELFPHMGERYPRTEEILTAEVAESFDRVDPYLEPKWRESVEKDYLSIVHDEDYVELIEEQYECSGAWLGENAALATLAGISFESTVIAAALIANGTYDFAYSLASGQHHAKRDEGGGFCAYNDVAGAAMYFRDQGLRPMVIDIDIHAGDGTQSILWNTDIPTVSVHAGSIFPAEAMTRDIAQMGTRHIHHWPDNHAYNFVLEDGAGDDSLQWAMNQIDPLVRSYRPEVVIFVVGADGHHSTPQNLIPTAFSGYTYRGFDATARRVREWVDEFCSGRILMTGAGGYEPLDHTPRIWANVAQTLAKEV